jgi:hypothetical protein
LRRPPECAGSIISQVSTDAILMNLQYAPAVFDQQQQQSTTATQQMLDIFAKIAIDLAIALVALRSGGIGTFRAAYPSTK